ncbi:DUF5753 domain-containing protein [Actinoplanes sp. NPDC023936]|uniref:DUF5753 domain-containing protein n=1 Tax=Actinoplanes sp. NPDC023936 TaxID=3154910 RepID=UPI0034053CAB
MTDDWLAEHNKAAERLERIIKDRMIRSMEAAGKLQKEMGQALGWAEDKVSRTLSLSRTSRLPTADDIRNWAQAAGESEESRDETLQLLADLKASQRTWKQHLRESGRVEVQDQYLRLYADTTRFRIFQTGVIPGILQIPEYARQLFVDLDAAIPGGLPSIEASVQKRVSRAQFLYAPGKEFEFLLSEAALRMTVVDPPVMRAQLYQLMSAMSLPNVKRFGIIPLMRRIHSVPQSGFMLYDDTAVLETPLRDQPYKGDEARTFIETYETHWRDAIEGDDARELIRRIMEEFPSV